MLVCHDGAAVFARALLVHPIAQKPKYCTEAGSLVAFRKVKAYNAKTSGTAVSETDAPMGSCF